MTKMNNDVAKAFPRALSHEVQALPAQQGATLMSVWSLIYHGVNHGYILLDEGLRRQVILTGSVDDMCVSGITTCGTDTTEAIRVARMNFEAARDLLSLAKASNPQPEQWAVIGASCGHAELRAQLILSGLYGVLEEGQANSKSAQQVQAARETGGAKRGEQMTAMADEWKATVFPCAIELDRKNPKWTRDKLATEILFQFEGKVPGYKAVTDWLAAEVEQPNGPIRSRARKKSA